MYGLELSRGGLKQAVHEKKSRSWVTKIVIEQIIFSNKQI